MQPEGSLKVGESELKGIVNLEKLRIISQKDSTSEYGKDHKWRTVSSSSRSSSSRSWERHEKRILPIKECSPAYTLILALRDMPQTSDLQTVR